MATGHNRQGGVAGRAPGKGVCFDWDGAVCHGKGAACRFDHPPGTHSHVVIKKGGRPARR